MNLWLPGEKIVREFRMVMCTLLNLKRITNVAHGNLLNVIFSLNGRGLRGRIDTCICMAESLHCSPETIAIFLISYTTIQTVFGVKNK